MKTEVPHVTNGERWPPKGLGWRTHGSRTLVSCPKSHVFVLDASIWIDGTVISAIRCPGVGCDFHSNLHLQGWPP